jgi:hypothetical protein
MINQHSFASGDHCDRDLFTKSETGERALNAAIVQAKISQGFEEYLEIFDFPLHVMAEIGGLSMSIRQAPIPGDAANETHSAWKLDLVGASGAACTLSWCTLRKWNAWRVVYGRHYDDQRSGSPLTFDDLNFTGANPAARFQRPS